MHNYKSGLGNVPSYQISSIPYCTASVPIDVSTPVEVKFYNITRFITVRNDGLNPLRLGFSSNGVQGTNYIQLTSPGESFSADFRLSELYLISTGGPTTGSIIAGLTTIARPTEFTNWSGSVGVG